MNHSRPKNLNLLSIHFPITAIVSILHRISGFVLFLILPLVLWIFSLSLTADGFQSLSEFLNSYGIKFIVWTFVASLCFHLIAGLRHLLMDVHIGDRLKTGRLTAYLVFILFLISISLVGVWLW